MQRAVSVSGFESLSSLIGMIYDCAIEPDRWPETLNAIRNHLSCANGALYVFDIQSMSYRTQINVGIEARWEKQMSAYYDDIAEIYAYLGDVFTRPLDKIFVMREEIPDPVLRGNRYFNEWAQPQGIDDLIQTTLMRNSTRMAMFAMGRHRDNGPVTSREVELLSLLSPHMRRAIRISDLIDMRTVEASTLQSSLDVVGSAVFLVAGNGEVLHSNVAARMLLERTDRLRISDGRLTADRQAGARLRDAISIAMHDEIDASSMGGGMVLSADPADFLIAYVLPLTQSEVRARLMPRAAAAVFVVSAALQNRPDLHPVAEIFGLTPMETQLLASLCNGKNLDESAAALSIARTTAKTHLAHLFEKTGVQRQSALIALAGKLSVAPIIRQ